MHSLIRTSVLLSILLFSFTSQAALHVHQSGEFVPGEWVVKLKSPEALELAAQETFHSLDRHLGGQALLSLEALKTTQPFALVRAQDATQDLDAFQFQLESHPDVEYAEPNFLYFAMDTQSFAMPDDPMLSQLWGMKNDGSPDTSGQMGAAGADIEALRAWDQGHTGSMNIKVAVIDTGIDWDHPDLVDNLYTNPGESGAAAQNGVDDDGNGYVDDTHGWNSITDDRNSDDDNNHGTHCAGTIGGRGNNGVGVVGVNWQVTLVPVKFLSASGSGSLADGIEAIEYARVLGVDIMSNSWGGGGFSQALKDAITMARDAGILFVAAAGNSNSNNDSTPAYPATYDVENVISVAASTNRDERASFSNWGQTTVHLAAPGNYIVSTVKGGGYDSYRGTSMACPHVAGAAALLKSSDPSLSYDQIKDVLVRSVDPVRSLSNLVISGGRLNVYNALNSVFPPPPMPPAESAWEDRPGPNMFESPHPYENSQEYETTISHPGAKYMRVRFERLETETGYDFVKLYDKSGQLIEILDGTESNLMSDYIDGDEVVVKLVSDSSITSYGYKIDLVQFVPQ